MAGHGVMGHAIQCDVARWEMHLTCVQVPHSDISQIPSVPTQISLPFSISGFLPENT